MYTADNKGSKYSPLGSNQRDAISASSKSRGVQDRQPRSRGPNTSSKARRSRSAACCTRPRARRGKAVVALDGRTGELMWVHGMDEGERASRWSPRQFSGRGVAYWTDGKGDERIIYLTTGYQMVALNAKTGQPVASFGKNGIVDLKVGVIIGKDKQIDLEKGEIGLHSPPIVVGDTIIVGSSMSRGARLQLQHELQGPGPRVRRQDRQAALALQHDSDAGRVRQRHVGKRLVGVDRQQRRVDADHRRSGSQPGLPAGRNADHRRVRRQPARATICSRKASSRST